MTRPRLLDLFCGAGGAAVGYHRAGFDVVGVDIEPQPEYPFEFVRDDALRVLRDACLVAAGPDGGPGVLHIGTFDAIHASPPCQGYTAMTNRHPSKEPKLIEPVRALLAETGLPYVIENVVGSPLKNPIRLCGSAFGLAAHRHRLFEASFAMFSTPCHHVDEGTAVYGPPDGRRLWTRSDGSELRAWASLEEGQEALGVPWMTNWHSVREAIPPAYTEFVGQQLMEQIARAA